MWQKVDFFLWLAEFMSHTCVQHTFNHAFLEPNSANVQICGELG
jgi:hypothetical protein